MEFFLITFLIILFGGFVSFLSAIFNNISIEDINNLRNADSGTIDLLTDFNNRQEYAVQGARFIESMTYILAGFSIGIIDIYYALSLSALIVSFVTCLIIIFFLKVIFVAVAAKYSIKLALKLSWLLDVLFKISTPLSKLYSKIFAFIAGKDEEDAARDEINALVESAMEEGSLDEDEYRLMKNVMHYSEVLVSDVMTPRTVVFSINADKTVSQVLNLPELQMYSRFPIWNGNSLDDGAVGYVVAKDILNAAIAKKLDSTMREFARDIKYIPENATLDAALEQFIKLRKHIFLVVDEYGGIEGLLSMEDVLENILGVEIVDEADRVVDLRELAKQRRDKRILNITSQNEPESYS